jgi:very-short-patch-repair endonuclease
MANGDDESDARRRSCHQRELIALEVVHYDRLRELGFSPAQIRRRVDQGWLHPVHHNVYAVGRAQVSPRAMLLAALLSAGPRAFLSHRTAAATHGLRAINTREIELTLPGSGGRRRRGMWLHRTQKEPHPADIRNRGDLRVSSVPRLLIELAPRERPAELERLVTLAVRKRLLRLEAADGRAAVDEALDRHARFPGVKKLVAVLAAYRRTEDHKSQLELAFDRILAEHPDIPQPQRNVRLGIWEIDRYWPEHRLAVELDGRPYHIAVADMERDRIKDAALQRLGVTPLRFSDFRVAHDVPGILGDLRHFLTAAG